MMAECRGPQREIEHALEVFVRGFCAVKSATHPYEHMRVGRLWVMRDGKRKIARVSILGVLFPNGKATARPTSQCR
jgi:hypothetical protein